MEDLIDLETAVVRLLPVHQAFHIPLQSFELSFAFVISSVSEVRWHIFTSCRGDLEMEDVNYN